MRRAATKLVREMPTAATRLVGEIGCALGDALERSSARQFLRKANTRRGGDRERRRRPNVYLMSGCHARRGLIPASPCFNYSRDDCDCLMIGSGCREISLVVARFRRPLQHASITRVNWFDENASGKEDILSPRKIRSLNERVSLTVSPGPVSCISLPIVSCSAATELLASPVRLTSGRTIACAACEDESD